MVLIAEYLSPGAKQLLESEQVGYYDSSGSLYLPAPGAYFYIEKPPTKTSERLVRSLFSGRRAQVLHALLINYRSWFGVHEMAELAMVSPATASEVFSELERLDWLASRGKGPRKGRQLCKPAALLDAWAKQVKDSPPASMARYYVPGVKTDGLLARISEEFGKSNTEYAVSYEAAAQRYAPYLSSISQVRVMMIKTPESQAAISDLGARAVTEGANLAIIDAESQGELLFRNRLDNIWLASPVQVYLDLLHGEGRAEREDWVLMAKPDTLNGYDERQTDDCERVLVTLLRGLGPWKDCVYLIGGLTPRYLVDARPPDVPAHAGTQDVDIVIDLQILADTEAYHTLEENLKKMGFERAENESGKKLSWRWQTKTEDGVTMILELIAESAELGGGKVKALPTEKTISALNVPYASMVFDLHEVREIQAELLGGNGVATEKVKYANLVAFTCLKSFAFDHRNERKDAHDLIYCLEHVSAGIDAATEQFRKELEGKHSKTIGSALEILRKRFATDENTEGYRKDGPVSVAKFELGVSDEAEIKERGEY